MRELSFLGFLKRYVRSLSLNNTYNLRKLAEEAAIDNPRLREPLFLYAVSSGKQERFVQAAQQVGLDRFYGSLLYSFDQETMLRALAEKGTLPMGYEKVWHSYQSQKNRHTTDNDTKELIRRKVLALQGRHKISNYRIYTDLKLNPGNLNAWLKHGDCGKISLSSARNVLKYVQTHG